MNHEPALYPMTFRPVLKDYVWGGRNLERLGRELPPAGIVAESWEIAAHEEGTTVVDNGPLSGKPLTQVLADLGLELVGQANTWALERGKFPLLVKLLDAAKPLSVQVHPDDSYAQAHEGNELGKTEMWVVLHAQPGAELVLGVHRGTTREAFARALREDRVLPLLRRVRVQAGDHICLPAGTLHAIMGGILLAEIQQNSNTTYRVYDWGRLGADGRPRPLHVAQALDVIDFERPGPRPGPAQPVVQGRGWRRALLCRNRYFVTEQVELDAGATFEGRCDGETLEIWGAIAGRAEIEGVALPAVRFTLLPAAMGPFTVRAADRGPASLLRTYVASP